MQIFLWLSLVIVLSAAIFAIQNSTAPPVAMKFLFWDFQTSLVYTILGSVGSGMLIILFLWFPRAVRSSLRAKDLKREIEFLQGESQDHVKEAKKQS
jgi:uncharacterized integral membrane protein